MNLPAPRLDADGAARHILGEIGELLAEQHLRDNGANILARNYRAPGGEADLIVWQDGELAAVEVKTRDVSDAEQPEEAVRLWKLKRIVLALTAFAVEADLLEEHWRVDLMAIETDGARVIRIDHIRDIFPP